MTWPTLSVIVINYNQGRFLPECLDAILAQSHGPHEVIFVDDCSTDDSVEIIPGLFGKSMRLLARYPDAGLCSTLAAKQLMVSKYSDLFRSDYVVDWERRRLFEVATSFVAASGEVEVEGLRRLLRPSVAVDGAFLAALRFVRRLELLATKLYLFCRLQPHHLHSELARVLRHVVRPGG